MFRQWVTTLAAIMFFFPISAAQMVDPSSLRGLCSQELTCAAWATSINLGRGTDPETIAGIPSKYWAEPIKALKPVKVYSHGFNIVVVLRQHDGIEEGKYITIPISSYLPKNGDDGFEFTPNPEQGSTYNLHEVLDYKRIRGK